ncbi:MAG: hypothetical protein GAK30_00941 [Paracidovorax wautersii]|uniref:DUF2065 domain-containing protein n=1 Tax=Paracidovorax wautersii TaxID=1177982 RepID=A0A7V8FQV6_9BURK|nr:MAG: hypothetical protein GAK30_00941 [Paracidovorax wautersii]
MSIDIWIIGLGIMLILEGLLPFLSPGSWRETMRRIAELDDRHIRLVGLGSMMAGLLLVWAMT